MQIMSRIPALLALLAAVAASPVAAQAAVPAAEESPKPARPAPRVDFDKLKFMAGCWEGQIDRETTVEEIWTSPTDNLLLALTRYTKKGKATGWEFTRIEATDSGVVFAAMSNTTPVHVYPLKTLVDEYVLFENPDKPFPQRIMYRRASDGALIPRNEGNDAPSVELRFRKVKCPGQ